MHRHEPAPVQERASRAPAHTARADRQSSTPPHGAPPRTGPVHAPAAVLSLQRTLGNQHVQQLLRPGPGPALAAAPVVQRRLNLDDSVSIMSTADQRLQQLSDYPALRQYWLHNVHRGLVKGFDDLAMAQEALGKWFEAIAGHEDDAKYVEQAWENIAAGYASIERKPKRPSADPRRIGPNAKTRAMEAAQGVIDQDQSLLEHNVELLQSNPDAVFYVIGKSAMGQGDTAFIVRTVNLLKGLGLKAMGVKAEKSAHDPGSSFKQSLDYITPEMLYEHARPGDFVIEGPLSDPADLGNPEKSTWFDTVAGKFKADASEIRNLRLYEYGTLTYRGGQQIQSDREKQKGLNVNVVNHAGNPRHAFMGMGHGEIGAFYNSNAGKEELPLEEVLNSHAKSSDTVQQIQTVLGQHADASIFIGYANSAEVAYTWASSVQQALGREPSGVYPLIVAVYGGKQVQPKFAIDDSTSITSIIDREKGLEKRGVLSVNEPKNATGSIVLTDSVPAPVMNALQRRAHPFTLATGNYSLSEAIENGHLASYETLPFNAGVEADYKWQLQNAMTNLQIDKNLQTAVMALASPGELMKKAKEIRLVLEHPDEIGRIMAEIRANTDITRLLVGRLAALEEARLGAMQ